LPSSASPLRQTKRLFRLPPDQLEAARSWFDHGERTPRKPRYASSVVLIRDSPEGTQTYLGYRSGSSPLGAIAFPGGTIDDEADYEPVPWYGPSAAKWAQLMGLEDHQHARALVVAAIRELFEESGILLAGQDESSLVEGGDSEEWMRARLAVAEQEKSFPQLLDRWGLGLRTDLLKPLSRWLSPDFAHRRFDTRYFAAAQPVSQQPSLLAGKGVWASWVCAGKVIAERSTSALGDLADQEDTRGLNLSEVSSPAVETILEKIASARGCIAYLSHKRPLRVYHPELVLVEGEPMLEVETLTAPEGGSLQRGR
jgi:8-oxo-dGTP pyrophosphatase MutT (NUDIX family)